MKRQLVAAAALAASGFTALPACAQDVYLGLGLLNVYTVGYAHSMGKNWGLRGELAGGTSLKTDGTSEGVRYDATFTSGRLGVFADWFPFGGGFRLVGGLASNDTKLDVNARSSGTATINGKTVDMATACAGGPCTLNVNIKYPSVTPYLGIGYGHHSSTKGLGFYFDLGVSLGSFTADVRTNLVGATVSGGGTISQSDVDEQKKKMNDSLAGVSVLPSLSLGLVYRY